MEVLVLGVNHKTAPLEIREKLSVPSHRTGEILDRFKEKEIFRERLILSTCNRTEIYGVGEAGGEDIERAKTLLGEYASLDRASFEDKLYVLRQPYSVEHLFSVASGLDSMVVGETEIIGQVKDAYQLAHQRGETGKVLNALFQRSLKVAKNLRSGTEIGMGRVSVASVAVDLASKIFGDLTRTHAFVLGTGEMASQVLKAFVSKGAQSAVISSRRFERAEQMVAASGGEALRYEDFEGKIEGADIFVASTDCPAGYLIHATQVRQWMKARHERPLFLIDIAVPRNIDPEVNRLDNVYLYNIDDLSDISEKNRALRESQVERCLGLVRTQTGRYMDWLAKEFGAASARGAS